MAKILDAIRGNALYTVQPNQTVREVVTYMTEFRVGAVPVIEGDRLVGMLSVRNLLMVDATQKEEEIRCLNAYIHYSPPGWG